MLRPLPALILFGLAAVVCSTRAAKGDSGLRVGVFEVDASPPVGSPLAYDPVKATETPLTCRGVVLAGAGDEPQKAIVLISLDWIGISSGGQDAFKDAVATAVGTDPHRVVVHTIHQHDAPRCDFSAEAILAEHGIVGAGFDPEHARSVVAAAADAAAKALAEAVASSRRSPPIGASWGRTARSSSPATPPPRTPRCVPCPSARSIPS